MDTAQIDFYQQAAITAWNKLQKKRSEPTSIRILQETIKSAIYKLEGLDGGSSAVIAKRCFTANAYIENIIYKDILPQLPISHPRFYGMVIEEDGDYSWLFLEFSYGEEYSRDIERHRIFGAQWLVQLHTRAPRISATGFLPDRGPKHYINRLRSIRNSMLRKLSNLRLRADDHIILKRAIIQCNFLESIWDEVDRFCGKMPNTLVHGDFVEENVRVGNIEDVMAIQAFDWEKAGLGVPAVDLAYVDIYEYYSAVSEFWPKFKLQDWQQLQKIGMIFRTIVHDWANKRIKKIKRFQKRLACQIQTAGLGNYGI